MNREQQEMSLWAAEYSASRLPCVADRAAAADAAVTEFRKRYPVEPAADDRLGRVAIEAMDAIMGAMREEHEDAKLLTLVERAAQNYMAARWHIQKETRT